MLQPIVSVIVPVYNADKYLNQCIDSIIRQSYKNLEIILVDDGSTDQSGEICDEYEKLDQRIKVLHKKNKGLVNARKSGISFVTGEYVTYVDSDDWIDLDRIERMVTAAVSKKADMIHAMTKNKYPNGSLCTRNVGMQEGYYEGEKYNKLLEKIVDTDKFYVSNIFLSLCAFLFKTEKIRNVQKVIPEKIRYNEDVACLFGVMLNSKNMIILGEGGYYYYRKRQDSMCHTVRRNERKNVKYFYDFYNNILSKNITSIFIKKELLLCTYYALFCCDYSALAEGEKYLFPFEKVTYGKRIAVYGAGAVGVMIVNYCLEHSFADIICWSDQAYENYKEYKRKYGIGVESPDNIISKSFDFLVISITDYRVAITVKNYFIQKGLHPEKIVNFDSTELFTEEKLQKIFWRKDEK